MLGYTRRRFAVHAAAALSVALVATTGAQCAAQTGRSNLGGPPPTAMETLNGVWIDGPGYKITYGGNYEGCMQLCLDGDKCKMVEYYKPQKKCNLYGEMRPRLQGGSSIVGLRSAEGQGVAKPGGAPRAKAQP